MNALGTVSPGLSIGILNVTGTLTLGGNTIMEINRSGATLSADLISAGGVVFGGTLTVQNTGSELQGGEVFNLFDGALSGTFAAIDLPVLTNPNLSWNTDSLATHGILWVQGGAPPPPTILPPAFSGGSLVLQFQSLPGYNYVLQSTPTLLAPVWTPVKTNSGGGLITISVPVNPLTPAQFFRLTTDN